MIIGSLFSLCCLNTRRAYRLYIDLTLVAVVNLRTKFEVTSFVCMKT